MLLVGIADKLYSARSVLSDYRQIGEKVWQRFSAPKEEQLWYYKTLVETFRAATAPRKLIGELSEVVETLKRMA